MLARRATVVSCPTTEGNLGDGYLPAMAYAEAGVPLAIGSDSQVRIDPFEEARELETGSRRERQLRSGLLASVGDLWTELCRNGYRSLGLGAELEQPTIEIDSATRSARGRSRGPAARAGHVRVGGDCDTGSAVRSRRAQLLK